MDVCDSSYDVIAVTENWLDNHISFSEILCLTYSIEIGDLLALLPFLISVVDLFMCKCDVNSTLAVVYIHPCISRYDFKLFCKSIESIESANISYQKPVEAAITDNPNEIFRYMLNRQSTIPNTLFHNKTEIISLQDIVNAFNNKVSSIYHAKDFRYRLRLNMYIQVYALLETYPASRKERM